MNDLVGLLRYSLDQTRPLSTVPSAPYRRNVSLPSEMTNQHVPGAQEQL